MLVKSPFRFPFSSASSQFTFSSSSFAVRPQAALRGGLETLVVIDEEGEAEGGGGGGKKLKEETMKKKKKKKEKEEERS